MDSDSAAKTPVLPLPLSSDSRRIPAETASTWLTVIAREPMGRVCSVLADRPERHAHRRDELVRQHENVCCIPVPTREQRFRSDAIPFTINPARHT